VERRALIAEALLTSAEGTEVLGGLGDLVIEEVEVDATLLVYDEAWSACLRQGSGAEKSQFNRSEVKEKVTMNPQT
jgi:hypothetical protein